MNEYDLYISGLSIPEINEKTKIPLSTLRFRFKKKNILRSRTNSIRLAFKKGRIPSRKGIKREPLTDKWKKNLSISHLKRGEKYAKGISLKPNGYYAITRGVNKGRSLHVVMMEEKIGRRLFHNECVHHVDQCKTNNNLDNLQLMTKSDHLKLHRELEKNNNKIKKRDKNGKFN